MWMINTKTGVKHYLSGEALKRALKDPDFQEIKPEPDPCGDLGGLTVAQLKSLADDCGIDLTGAGLKAEIIDAIQAALKPSGE